MSSALDQIFVHGKQWLLSWVAGAPNWVIQITSSLINIVALLAVFLTLFALISVLERKILGRMQNRTDLIAWGLSVFSSRSPTA